MKYKKYSYILVLILMLLVGMDGVNADEKVCHYLSSDNQAAARLVLKYGYKSPNAHTGKKYSEAYVQKLGTKIDNDTEPILNWYNDFKDNRETKIKLDGIYNNRKEANNNPSCPNYLILRTNDKYTSYGVFATNSVTIAQKFVNESNKIDDLKAWYATYKDETGVITDEEYAERAFGFVKVDPNADFDAHFDCEELFGDKNDKDSIAYMINEVLTYIRIIVPILIIVLGTLDFAKAVIASKEDEMRRAQMTFIKRLIIGIAVFFVPVLVNLIMEFADILWEGMGYTTCKFQ